MGGQMDRDGHCYCHHGLHCSIGMLIPLSNIDLSLGFNLLSPENVLAEGIGLAIFFIWIIRSQDVRRSFFEKGKDRLVISLLPIIPLLGFVGLIWSYSITADMLTDHGILQPSKLLSGVPSLTANPLFLIELSMHLILLAFLSTSLFQKVMARKKEKMANAH